MPGPVTGRPTVGVLSDIVLNPGLWRWLLFVGQPVRLAIAANVILGRSVRALSYDFLRRLNDFIAWLYGRVRHRRLLRFERRYFPIRRWHAAAAAIMAVRGVQLCINAWKEHASGRAVRRRQLQAALISAETHEDWLAAAMGLQRLAGVDPAVQAAKEEWLYDKRLLVERARHLRRMRERGDALDIMFAVRSDLLRNLGNMTNAALHQQLLLVPPTIREYIDEARACLRAVAQASAVPLDDRLAFLRETRHAFGRTALVLSGGGSFGSFHLGVVKALLDAKLLPRVLSGSSAGAIVAALICTRTDDELAELFAALPERLQGIDFYSSNSTMQILRHLVLKGTLQDHRVLQERLQRLLGDVTFQEAYTRSGRILNVSVSAADTKEPPRLLNYLTAPNVIVWSAVAASSAFPFLFAPQALMARDARGFSVPFAHQAAGEAQRRWRDGSLEEDLPMRGLSEMFNVNYFLVSQCNPYLLPIIGLKGAAPRTLGTLVEQEFKHRCKQLMELLPRQLGASRVLKLLSQPWEGDVTMVLPATTLSTLKAVVNLSREDLLRALAEGQRATWAKLSSIAANCDVEVTLDSCLRQVTVSARRARMRLHRRASALTLAPPGGAAGGGGGAAGGGAAAGGGPGMRRGIPSWLHLQSLGIPHATSLEALEAEDEPRGGTGGIASTPFTGSYAGMLHVRSARSVPALQLDLTDTVVPEDAELAMTCDGLVSDVALEEEARDRDGDRDREMDFTVKNVGSVVNGGSYGVVNGGVNGDNQGDAPSPSDSMPSSTSPTSPKFSPSSVSFRRTSVGYGEDVWRDLFELAPATVSDGLDFIAP